jgi:predicted phage terminase large subunit-like protein
VGSVARVTEYDYFNAICRDSLAAFTAKAFNVIEPSTPFEHNWHVDCIAEHLQAVWDGQIRLLAINMPPRSLKTHTTSVSFPAWGMGKDPSVQFMLTSFKASLAEKMTRKTRSLMQSQWYQECFTRTRLSDELNRQYYFETTERGQYFSSSMSNVMGEGAAIQICFPAGTMIATLNGDMKIEDIIAAKQKPLIASYNHADGRIEYKEMLGESIQYSDDFIEISCGSGYNITCTPSHKVFVVGRGYVRAENIKAGEILVAADASENSIVKLCALFKGFHQGWQRIRQGSTQGANGLLLFQSLQPTASRHEKCAAVQGVPNPNARKSKLNLLFKAVSLQGIDALGTKAMRALWCVIQAATFQNAILPAAMCRQGAFKETEGNWQSKLSRRWGFLQQAIQADKAQDISAGWIHLRSLWHCGGEAQNKTLHHANAAEFSGASYRRRCVQQCVGESSLIMRILSHFAPQVRERKVAVVRRLRKERQPVYDLTIRDNHNFFANGLLAHNCDDPLAPDEALSDQIRNTTNETIRGSLFSRFNDPRTGRFILNMQRLHDDDPTGNLLKDTGWYHLKLPAEAKARSYHYSIRGKSWDMPQGAFLFPSRFTPEVLAQTRTRLGDYAYAGQYLQEPVPIGGGLINATWLQYYAPGAIKPKEMNIAILVDPAGGDDDEKQKKDKNSDWTAMMVVGLANDNNYYLLDIVRDRLNPTERIDMLFLLHRKWNKLSGKSPKVGYEKYSMQSDTHYLKQKMRDEAYNFPLFVVSGQKSKTARVSRLVPDMQNGRWYLPQSLIYVDTDGRKWDLVQELLNVEIKTFPMSKYDDMLDALSRIYEPELCMAFPAQKQSMVAKARREFASAGAGGGWEDF